MTIFLSSVEVVSIVACTIELVVDIAPNQLIKVLRVVEHQTNRVMHAGTQLVNKMNGEDSVEDDAQVQKVSHPWVPRNAVADHIRAEHEVDDGKVANDVRLCLLNHDYLEQKEKHRVNEEQT